MTTSEYKSRTLNGRPLQPETLMMGYGYSPALSEGALKPPIFLTSTFVFATAQQGKDFFDLTAGRRQPRPGEKPGLVYSRFNNPNFEILEDRLAVWDGAERSAVFASGMAAIATVMLAILRPGDTLLHSRPLYGGTETLIRNQLTAFGITPVGFTDGCDPAQIDAAAEEAMAKGPVGLIMLETPANPTNGLVDLAAVRRRPPTRIGERQGRRPPIAVDNTLLGPMYQQPAAARRRPRRLLADQICRRPQRPRRRRRQRRRRAGPPDHAAARRARHAARPAFLLDAAALAGDAGHPRRARQRQRAPGRRVSARAIPRIRAVHYLGFLAEGDPRRPVFDRQCTAPGSTFSFDIDGGEAEAFAFLDRLQVMKLAVSLGGTETLISHPASTTHSGVPRELREEIGLTDALIRISVGIEHPDDLIADLEQALG